MGESILVVILGTLMFLGFSAWRARPTKAEREEQKRQEADKQ